MPSIGSAVPIFTIPICTMLAVVTKGRSFWEEIIHFYPFPLSFPEVNRVLQLCLKTNVKEGPQTLCITNYFERNRLPFSYPVILLAQMNWLTVKDFKEAK